ncbi:MAG: PIG-L family deacetylase [Chitinophagaceae bacterium]|nr:PIG-L family deacetylase [Chitinophagaceae bacterium]
MILRIQTLTFLLLLICNFEATAQGGSSAILQKIKKLNTVGSVLYIAAHPDDENTRLLGYLANERKLKTGYLSLTRGDGGQNLIGKEQGEMLGLIRTQELLAARRIDGAEQFFSRAYDFGYSKTPEETFSFWDKEAVLADVVWVIRNFKPDVIICRFPTTGEGGHGHHTASAMLAVAAFKAAADPTRFPEQLSKTTVWQAKRLFWNTFNFGGLNTTSENQIKLDVGGYNALLGKSYGEMAAESRTCHKSQGFGSAKMRGEQFEFFKQLDGDSAKKDVFEGIQLSWPRFANTNSLKEILDNCIAQFDAQSPEKSIPALIRFYKQLQNIKSNDAALMAWKATKQQDAQDLILACAGLWIETTASDFVAIPGKEIAYTTQIVCRNKATVSLSKISFLNTDTITNLALKSNQLYSFKRKEQLQSNTTFSNPYWLSRQHTAGAFIVENQDLIGKGENEAALNVNIDLEINGEQLLIKSPIVFKSTDPVKGEIYRPLEVLPVATINAIEPAVLLRNDKPKVIQFVVKANAQNVKGIVQMNVSEGWDVTIENPNFDLKNKNDEAIIEATIIAKGDANAGELHPNLLVDNVRYNHHIRRIDYDHIPAQFTLSASIVKLQKIDIKKAGKNIGYLPGAGDEVASCLQQIGYNVTQLTDDLLAITDLKQFDAIVSGIRAYNTNDKLQSYHKKLMNYVASGGNMIVQYNTNNRISTVPPQIGPYPFVITRERVTDELAKVNILDKNHAAFNFPNKISEADFANWIQERGIYFATDSANNYQKLLSMQDPNEKANEGSLLLCSYGKGNFVYTGLAFFRQLPAGVPGAYRLFVNLLSLPPNETKNN